MDRHMRKRKQIEEDCAVKLKQVSMVFNKSTEKIDNLKEYLIKFCKGSLRFEEFWALKDITLSVHKGETLGIVGLNGSGKSTLLKIVAGVLSPTSGSVQVQGSIAPLIELGAGFDMELTARENVFLNGAVLGYSHKEMEKKFNSIIDFAELWEFVDMPIKNYSSGMVTRLGFAIATTNTPDILIVDEVLSVGDFKFRKKCKERMKYIIDRGATVLFVSHDQKQVEEICDRVIWLEQGKICLDGDCKEVCNRYFGT